MNTRIAQATVALATFLVSSTAFAWAVPIHKCWFPSTPTPVGTPIPCSYTNQDGATFNGVVTTSSNGEVLCTGLLAPTPNDTTEAASFEELYSSLGDNYDEAPYCAVQGTSKGSIAECPIDGEGGGSSAYVKVCGDGWCLELSAYVDCADYNSTEIPLEGVTCYDLT